MSYKSTFLDNAEYSALDINNRLKKYVTSGLEDPFTNGVPYNASKLNDLTAPLSTKGVVPETDGKCKVSIDTTEKTVTIATGTCFFDNGTDIEITSGETLPYVAGVKNYVYVKSDLSANEIKPHCTTTEPSGDYVLLAEISTNEILTDKRQYATGKLVGYQSNFNIPKKISYTMNTLPDSIDLEGYYTCIVVQGQDCCGIYDNGTYYSVGARYNGTTVSTEYLLTRSVGGANSYKNYIKVEIDGTTLNITEKYIEGSGSLPFTLYAF